MYKVTGKLLKSSLRLVYTTASKKKKKKGVR